MSMLRIFSNRKAQNTAEYAIIIALVVAAAVAMQTYLKRNMQGGVKYAVDKLPAVGSGQSGGQYEPYYLESAYQTSAGGNTQTVTTAEGGKVTKSSSAKVTSRTGYQKEKAQ